MKKYHICFFLLLGVLIVVLGTGFFLFPGGQEEIISSEESPAEPETVLETETTAEDQIVINQKQIQHKANNEEKYFLVSEDGFLLVFGSNRTEICLYTHIPIVDFPEAEQEKLRQGIWFPGMEEIYSYLESYTS